MNCTKILAARVESGDAGAAGVLAVCGGASFGRKHATSTNGTGS
jgi:hypothetical protein